MLTLWNPLIPIKTKSDSKISTKHYFDRLFEDTFNSALHDLFSVPDTWGIESKKNEDGSLAVTVDMPGIQEEDISIEIDENVLVVKGKRNTAVSSYSVQKSFTIPEGYDSNEIVAELKNGVLNLKLVGKPLPPPKEIKKILLTSKKQE